MCVSNKYRHILVYVTLPLCDCIWGNNSCKWIAGSKSTSAMFLITLLLLIITLPSLYSNVFRINDCWNYSHFFPSRYYPFFTFWLWFLGPFHCKVISSIWASVYCEIAFLCENRFGLVWGGKFVFFLTISPANFRCFNLLKLSIDISSYVNK